MLAVRSSKPISSSQPKNGLAGALSTAKVPVTVPSVCSISSTTCAGLRTLTSPSLAGADAQRTRVHPTVLPAAP